jgi:hypothetical protein
MRFLRAVYRVRDAIAVVRAPFISSGEVAAALQDEEALKAVGGAKEDAGDRHESFQRATREAYAVRWRAAQEATTGLELVAVEAEVLWGDAATKISSALRKCVNRLSWAIGTHFRAQEDDRRAAVTDKLAEEAKQIVFYMGGDPEQDPFSNEIHEAVSAAERFVRPKLG